MLVDGFIVKRGVGFLIGHPGSGKSYACLDLVASCNAGKDTWAGIPLNGSGPAVFVAGEGQDTYIPRLGAWENYYGLADDPFFVRNIPALDDNSFDLLQAGMQDKADKYSVVVFDNFAGLTSGREENEQQVAKDAWPHFIALRDRFDCTVVIIAHVAKDITDPMRMTPRGGGAAMGAADFVTAMHDSTLHALPKRHKPGKPVPLTFKETQGEEGLFIPADPLLAGRPKTQQSAKDRTAQYQLTSAKRKEHIYANIVINKLNDEAYFTAKSLAGAINNKIGDASSDTKTAGELGRLKNDKSSPMYPFFESRGKWCTSMKNKAEAERMLKDAP